MYTPSKVFLDRMGQEPCVIWVVGSHGSVAVDNCTVTRSWCGSQFTLGSACAGEFKAAVQREKLPLTKGEQVRLEIGLNGLEERVPVGVFTLTAVQREIDDDRYTLTGRDAIGEGLEEFYGGDETLTASAVLREICRRNGLAVPQVGLPEDAKLTVEEKTMRALLAEIALLSGGNAGIDRFGALRLGGWSGDVCDLSIEDYYQSKLHVDEKDYVLGLLEVTDGEKTYEAQLEGLTEGLKLRGSMTQTAFDRIWNQWKKTTFRPGQVELPDGMWLDPGDLLRITDSRGQVYTMPVLEVSLTFDGGFRTLVRANVAEQKAGTAQTVSQAVNGLKVEVGRFHKIYTEKLDAASATIGKLQTDVLQARTILVCKPDGEVILRADADTGELVATAGTVGGLTMSSHTLSAEYRHDYPKFTQADIDRAEQGVLGSITLTEEERAKYDVNMDGRVSSVDLLAMKKMLSGAEQSYSVYRLTIDPTCPKACVKVEVIDGYHTGWKVELGVGMAQMRNLSVTGQVTIGAETLTDFVTKQGFDQVWEWRLWNSGLAECWCVHTFAPVAMVPWGSLYQTKDGAMKSLPYPVSFIEEPACTMTLVNATNTGWLCQDAWNPADRLNETPRFGVLRAAPTPDGTLQPTVAFRVIGRWK